MQATAQRLPFPGRAFDAAVSGPDFFLTRFWAAATPERGTRPPGDERGRWSLCSPDGLGTTSRAQA